ncbi:hypothetical protein PN823_004430 [Enterobacter hormaechei]|nr:hypothetical protein [Enterobacter hormaechei]
MKLITPQSTLKTVDYFGIPLDIPHDTRYLAASPRGTVSAWSDSQPKPVKAYNGGYWWTGDDHDFLGEVAQVDLEGLDWTKTCVCVGV